MTFSQSRKDAKESQRKFFPSSLRLCGFAREFRHCRLIAWWSLIAAATSRSNRPRSSAFTSMAATKVPWCDWSQSTSMSRSPCPSASDTALAQSARWTETPRPRVTKPRISSPGTGVQHRDSRTIRSSSPSTWTPAGGRFWEAGRRWWRAVLGRVSSSALAGSTPRTFLARVVSTSPRALRRFASFSTEWSSVR